MTRYWLLRITQALLWFWYGVYVLVLGALAIFLVIPVLITLVLVGGAVNGARPAGARKGGGSSGGGD